MVGVQKTRVPGIPHYLLFSFIINTEHKLNKAEETLEWGKLHLEVLATSLSLHEGLRMVNLWTNLINPLYTIYWSSCDYSFVAETSWQHLDLVVLWVLCVYNSLYHKHTLYIMASFPGLSRLHLVHVPYWTHIPQLSPKSFRLGEEVWRQG